MPHVWMCPPEYYGIEYEINAWMSRERPSDRAEARRQWQALRRLIESLGAKVSTIPPLPGLPDMVFTANAGLVYHNGVVMSRFKPEQRRGETPECAEWLRHNGYRTLDPPEGLFFEGAGDALFCGDTLFAGYRQRSDARGCQQIGALLGVQVLPLELVDPYFYHLDTCFCPLAPGQALWHPPAFDDYAQRVLAANVPELIEVSHLSARRFGCNAVVIGRHVITNAGCQDMHAALRSAGFTPHETLLDEFVKAGGSAKCLTLRLDGEDAAGWRGQA